MTESGIARLRSDYQRIGLSGIKQLPAADPATAAALARLTTAGLAVMTGSAFTLQRPEYAKVDLDSETSEVLGLIYAAWLRAEGDDGGDEVLYGELGYWQHWWNMLHVAGVAVRGTLRMDVIVDSSFSERAWLSEMDDELLDTVVNRGLLSGRVIVGPSVLESPAEGIIDLAQRIGFEARVLPDAQPYSIYDGSAVVLVEPCEETGGERYRLTRRASVVAPLQTLFDLQWATAIPWNQYRQGAGGVLHLLAAGWPDARIAAALGVSGRTVSRRIADAMAAVGARSRFELGMRYASHGVGAFVPDEAAPVDEAAPDAPLEEGPREAPSERA